ncbi:condensation domain-containing protein, partial [Streptomyces sp. NPDC127077]|uniref:condensation domain-containing protein n=1 Tax=Streptomyces sp. NPDC127077 TaxID=3347131 RepID=UPI00364C6CDE
QHHTPDGVPQHHTPDGVPQHHTPDGVPQHHTPDGVPQHHAPDGTPRDGVRDGVPDGVPGPAGRAGRYLLRLSPRGPLGPDSLGPDGLGPDGLLGPAGLPGPEGSGPPLTDDLLADLLAPPAAGTVPVRGHQRALLAAAAGQQGGPGRFVEQLHWDWTGPLDLTRFIASWQSLAEREAVLRASFDWAGAPRLVLHERAAVEVVHHGHADDGWQALLRRERERGFDLYRPPLLRVSLFEGPPPARRTRPGPATDTSTGAGTGAGAGRGPVRLLVTYHRALLDERGVRLLVRQLYRSYLAGGVLPGADRRPDIRDHAHWLTRQDTAAAREFWAASAPPAGAALTPARPGEPPSPAGETGSQGGGTGSPGGGTGRIRRVLRPVQSARLRSWAGGRGVGESSALHLAWALLLYRAAGTTGPLPVAFGVHLSGRDMALRGGAGIPGLLGGPLPMTVTVDGATPLADLLVQVRDAALDLTAYAWVCAGQVRRWSGRAPRSPLTGTTVRFETHPELPANLRAELAAQAVTAGAPHSAGGVTTVPITLVAHHDTQDALVLDALYDRARFTDTDAAETLAQCLHLLRSLPERVHERSTVADALALLGTSQVPVMTVPPPGRPSPALRVLRAGRAGADLVCLVTVPGVTPGAYDLFLRAHRGPERIVSLTLAGGQAPPGVLADLPGDAGRLTVCGAGPAGPAAHGLARRTARHTGRVPAVVMTGLGSAAETALALSRALQAVRARTA